tara:strand:+ start:2531 stop:3106 length:576 start_codon:yes stop_codon:yes gene_type:complete
MAGTGALALLASIVAVLLLRATLIETRQIGQAQTRAHLAVTKARFVVREGALEAWLTVANDGHSPADCVRVNGEVTVGITVEIDNQPIRRSRDTGETDITNIRIPAGGSDELPLYWGVNSETFNALITDDAEFHMFGDIAWTDVFDTRHSAGFVIDVGGSRSRKSPIIATYDKTVSVSNFNIKQDDADEQN